MGIEIINFNYFVFNLLYILFFIASHQQLIERAHARGLAILGGTLTPYWGAGYYTEAGEAKRQALNDWIRTSKAYDGVIDFDKATW